MENKEKYKIILIIGLSIIILILTLFYIFSDKKDIIQEKEVSEKISITPDRFRKDIDSILYSFGIKKEWINSPGENKKEKNKQKEEHIISESVQIPGDILTINLNYEISGYLEKNGFNSVVKEDPKTKDISMEIYQAKDSLKKKFAQLNFIYSDKINRNVSEVCIVLDSIEYTDLGTAEKILNSSERFSVFLPLENDKADFQSMILDEKKNYLLKFYIGNDEDITTDFRPDMKESIIRQRIRTIALNFPGVSGIVLYSSKGMKEFENRIREEFIKNNFRVFSDTLFKEVRTSDGKVERLFSDIRKGSERGIKIQFYIIRLSEDEFEEYEKRTDELKKPGFRFIGINEAIERSKRENTAVTGDTLKTDKK
ncbi:MAG: hypothetical protein JSS91_03590 [Bacteroidetes bacterium]|nr:hypothetical protein [Bacteroidota bacterium]